jgi:mannose-6-phosphate isomerase-like protein (cupin superfamily)
MILLAVVDRAVFDDVLRIAGRAGKFRFRHQLSIKTHFLHPYTFRTTLPEKQTPLHRHTRYSKHIYELEGEFAVWAGEYKLVLNAGERFLIPVGIPYTFGVLNERPGCGLVMAVPSGFARLIAAAGRLSQTEPIVTRAITSENGNLTRAQL